MDMKIIFRNLFGKITLVTTICLLLAFNSVYAATRMPSFSLPNAVTGATINSTDFTGKTLLITFFATWCPPCMQEVPTLIELHQQFSKADFSVIGMAVDQGGADVVATLVKKRAINYPVVMADETTAHNFGGIVGIPTSFLINKEGNVVKKYPGYIPHSVLEQDIKKIMN